MIARAVGAGRMLFSLVIVLFGLLSLLAEFVVLTFTLTSPVGLLEFLFTASLIPTPAIKMSSTAPPAPMSGIL